MRLHENGTLPQAWEIRNSILRLVDEDDRWKRGMIPKMANWLRDKGCNDQPFIASPENARASPQSGGRESDADRAARLTWEAGQRILAKQAR